MKEKDEKLHTVSTEDLENSLDMDAMNAVYGCGSGCGGGCGSGCGEGCGSGCGEGCGSGCGYGCGDGDGNDSIPQWVSFDPIIRNNAKLFKQCNALFKCPTIIETLKDCTKGTGNLVLTVGDTGDGEMKTDLKNGKAIVTISKEHVDSKNGYNFSSNGIGSAGYKYDGTKQGTFAGAFSHEAFHSDYDMIYENSVKGTHGDENKVYENMCKRDSAVANAFFVYDPVAKKWTKREDAEIAKRQHELIGKEHSQVDKIVGEYKENSKDCFE